MFVATFLAESDSLVTLAVTIINAGLLAQVSSEQQASLHAGLDFFGSQADSAAARPVAKDLFRVTPRAIAAGTTLGAYTFAAAVTLVDITLQAYASGGDYVGSLTGDSALLTISGATTTYAKSPAYIPPTPPDYHTIPLPVTTVDTGAETPGTLYLVPDAPYDVVIPTRPGRWVYDPHMDEDYWVPEEPAHTVTEPSPWEGGWMEIASEDWYCGGGFEVNDGAYVNLSFAWCWGPNRPSIFTTTGTFSYHNNLFRTFPGQLANVAGNIYGRKPSGSRFMLRYSHTWEKVEIGVAYAPNGRVYWRPGNLPIEPLRRPSLLPALAGLLLPLLMMAASAAASGIAGTKTKTKIRRKEA
jgi:hypothetical protein